MTPLFDWLLRWVLPRGAAGDAIRGDLIEELMAAGNRPVARMRYAAQALSVVVRYAFRRRAAPRQNQSPRRPVMETLRQDVTFAVRSLVKRPSVTLMVIGTLALGIGANTAIFSLVNALLLRPLPYEAPHQLAVLYERSVMGTEQRMAVAPGNFLDWQEGSRNFEHITAHTTRAVAVARDLTGGEPERVVMCQCSGNVFAMTRVNPVLGRAFRLDEDRFGANRVVVIGFELWQRHYGGAADVVGRSINIDNEPYQIIGVAPRGFMYPSRSVQVWQPLLTSLPPQQQIRHDLHYLRVAGRLREGVSLQQAQAEVDAISGRYKAAHPQEATGDGAAVIALHDDLTSNVRRPVTILFVAVVCVLLIACVNIANLMLTRAVMRTREIGIRRALGASRLRIVRQLVTESVLLGLVSGIAGAALAFWLGGLLAARAPGAEAILPEGTPAIDLPVLSFALAIALVAGSVVGLLPAIRGSRAHVAAELRQNARGTVASTGHRRYRDVLIAVEVALSVVLLTVAGLLVHSFLRLYQVSPGVRVENMLSVGTQMVGPEYRAQAKRSATLGQLSQRLRALPGVADVGLVSCLPLTGTCNILFFYVEGRPYLPGKFHAALERSADPGYFAAAGIPLLRGRTFTPEDGVGFDPKNPRPGRVVISESMAKTFFPGEDPLGKRIVFDFEMQRERIEGLPAPRYEVIGIVGDVRPTLQDREAPMLYRPLLDIAGRGASILLHTKVEPQSVIAAVREEIRRIDPTMPVFQWHTMDELMGLTTSEQRFNMLLVTAFAGLAVLLAVIGLYGVVSYAVTQRTSEIGVRLALGATEGDVSRMVVRQGLKPAIAGTILGLVAAALSTGLVRSLLFGVTPTDPLTFTLVPLVLLTSATLACYVPARRAARLDPTVALRVE